MAYEEDTGKICGFYIEGMQENIPAPNAAITEEQHAYCMAHNGWVKWDIPNKKIVDIPAPEPDPKTVSVEERLDMMQAALDSLMMGGI